ncbi:MAG: peptidoglycan D,D-transpeptidase FtsI family protein [Halothiobacillaceae bacterium]|jgi:cell division protein FtsI (penicillin-binding protein 3)
MSGLRALIQAMRGSGWRYSLVVALFFVLANVMLWRAVYLKITERDFLEQQGGMRYERVQEISAHRGQILDRNGEPLAVSTPMETVWVDPRELMPAIDRVPELAHALGLEASRLRAQVQRNAERRFLYIKRQITPEEGERVKALRIPGVNTHREYRRFYPTGEVTAHILGFTNIDDQALEGIERTYDHWLRGEPGARRVIKDLHGGVIETRELIREARPGNDLVLSLDRRLQYLAYRELKAAVQANKAKGGTAVLLDVRTGEILAMVNQPSFNPNDRTSIRPDLARNRAVIDAFEPGSTMKPFSVAVGLESGKFSPDTLIDTHPGVMKVDRFTIRDHQNYGLLDVTGVIRKSSNIGVTKIAMAVGPEALWSFYDSLGLGRVSGTGFPGESSGRLRHFRDWNASDIATHAYGYGMSVTALQLVRAYGAIAHDGVLMPVSFLKVEQPPEGKRVMDARVAQTLRAMMEEVVKAGGTGTKAQVSGYRVAGKTGTAHKSQAGGYAEDKYVAVFAGMAPATKPRLALAVMIDEPSAGVYYGGQVAGPVFSAIMEEALRILNVAPDAMTPATVVSAPAKGGQG